MIQAKTTPSQKHTKLKTQTKNKPRIETRVQCHNVLLCHLFFFFVCLLIYFWASVSLHTQIEQKEKERKQGKKRNRGKLMTKP